MYSLTFGSRTVSFSPSTFNGVMINDAVNVTTVNTARPWARTVVEQDAETSQLLAGDLIAFGYTSQV